MEALTISLQIAAIQEKTRRLAMWSLLVHAAGAVLFLVASGQPRPLPPMDTVLTEVTWLEPEEATPVVVTQEAPAAEPEPMPTVVAQVAPEPVMPDQGQSVAMVRERLAALRQQSAGALEVAATAAPQKTLETATVGSLLPRAKPAVQNLERGGMKAAGQAQSLRRGQASVVAAAMTLPHPVARTETTAPLLEILPGVSLAGQVQGRQLLSHPLPEYPDWAKRDGVEVVVQLYFTVLPDGRVKENILIERTSGYEDFDRRARTALAAWKFQELTPGQSGEQWGRIAFHYRLRS
jgi:TonB family protein|nr:TonB family protein [Candidatus Krumholzibacteria bacterium]